MKKFIQWLAKVFNANITETVEVIKEVQVYIPENGMYDGDLYVKGNLHCTGDLNVEGNITAFSKIQ